MKPFQLHPLKDQALLSSGPQFVLIYILKSFLFHLFLNKIWCIYPYTEKEKGEGRR